MSETRIEILILQRLEQEQKDANARLERISERIGAIERRIAEVKGEVTGLSKPRSDVHWTVRNVLAPLLVAIIVTSAGLAYHDLDKRLGNIEAFFHDNSGFIAGLRLQQNAVNPSDPHSIQDAKLVLAEATRAKIAIPAETVRSAGDKFLQASKNDPQVWNTALSFVDYRSLLNLLNSTAVPKLTDGRPDKSFGPQRFGSHLRTPSTGNRADDEARGRQAVEAQQALLFGNLVTENFAVMERMENPLNDTKGYQFIVYQIPNHPEAELVLDGLHMRNVIIKNMRIAYYGGPVRLESVYFVNCTFSFPSPTTTPTLDFASAILASPATTFIRNA